MTQIPKFAEQVMRIMAQTAEEIPMLVFRDGNKEIAYRKKIRRYPMSLMPIRTPKPY